MKIIVLLKQLNNILADSRRNFSDERKFHENLKNNFKPLANFHMRFTAEELNTF